MSRIRKQITVVVQTSDGQKHRMELDEVRSIGGAFLTAVGVYPTWIEVVITVKKCDK
jgi:hypothetical protein